MGARLLYVRVWRGLRAIASPIGLLRWLERQPGDGALWLRSLFAIYDIDDMIRLDIPWWTLSARRRVDAFLKSRPQASVLEWGSGASTVWLAKRAQSVVSVEHDPDWFELVRSRLPANATLLHRPAPKSSDSRAVRSHKRGWKDRDFTAYVRAISELGRAFDLIVIDGRCREQCLLQAMEFLKPDGMIVFDNTGRGRYRSAIRASGLASRVCPPPTACLPYYDPTTLLAREPGILRTLA